MSNALDMFRAQRAAIEQVYDRINDVAVLLGQLKIQVDQIAHDPDLRNVLQRKLNWLES